MISYVMVICSAVNTVAVVYETVKSVLEESVKDWCVVSKVCMVLNMQVPLGYTNPSLRKLNLTYR
jgi:hypothetical protein